MVVLFIAVLGLSLVHTINEADAVDTERTRQAVNAAVDAQIQQIVIMADDNAVWDDATKAVYGGMVDKDFFWSSWGISTAESKNYDTAIVLDHQNRPLLAYHRGRAVRLDPASEYGAAFAALEAELDRKKQAIGGIASTRGGLVLMAMADIVPTDPTLDRLVPRTGAYRLFFTRPFEQASADAIGRSLFLENMALSRKAVSNAGIAVHDTTGQAVAALNWTPAHPGVKALGRALPWIALGALIHLMIGILVSRQALRSVRKLAEQAFVDSLSKLPNRRALRQELEKRLKRRERLALALIDLDGFKGINDNYGHNVGDRLIKIIAELLTRLVGDRGMIARLGGDEFAVMIAGSGAVGDLQDIARALLAELSRPFRIDERTVLIGASIGLASVSLNDLDDSELMRRADVAMYAAKRAGKMRMSWYDEMLDQKQAVAHTLEMELRAAIETEAFDLVYQPMVDIADRKIVAVEALLRWASPTRGEVDPSEFIPIAEETGLIDRMGMIVLRRACREGLDWGNLHVAINVSAAQLRNPEFASELGKVLEETGFPAQRLELEIGEAYLLYDPDTARRVLHKVRALGVSISLDDFGTGYASIGFLRKFAFNKIKLDQSLVREAEQSETVRTVVQASIAVGRALEMAISAEGVETDAQADMMRIAGCDQMQGWLVSKAVSAEEVADRLHADFPEGGSRLRAV